MFNQHHTHYMSSSKIIPCSCKGNAITSTDGSPAVLKVKPWETQWHECKDRKNKVSSRYLIFTWVWMFTTITLRALYIYEVRKTTQSESFSAHALLPQHCLYLRSCPQWFPVCLNVRTMVPEPHMWRTTPLTCQNSHIWHPEKENIRGWVPIGRICACKQTVCW